MELISLYRALRKLGACDEIAHKYRNTTLEKAWEACDSEDDLQWIYEVLYSVNGISERTFNMLDNAYCYGLIKNTRDPYDLQYVYSYCMDEEKCIAAIKASVGVRTIRNAINKGLRSYGLKLEK